MNYEARQELNIKHGENPQPGDYWHEMSCPMCVVLGVSKDGTMVRICTTITHPDSEHWTWDLTEQELVTRAEFKRRLMYSTMPKYVGMVEPGHMQWAVDAAA